MLIECEIMFFFPHVRPQKMRWEKTSIHHCMQMHAMMDAWFFVTILFNYSHELNLAYLLHKENIFVCLLVYLLPCALLKRLFNALIQHAASTKRRAYCCRISNRSIICQFILKFYIQQGGVLSISLVSSSNLLRKHFFHECQKCRRFKRLKFVLRIKKCCPWNL